VVSKTVVSNTVVGSTVIDPETEYLIWQTIVGAWPISDERLTQYLTKAIREEKRRTSWTEVHQQYEDAVLGLARRALADGDLAGSIAHFVDGIAADAAANSLGAKLVQLTMPGVPDIYQGCEGPGFSLVDPDNRRDPGIARLRAELAALDSGAGRRLGGDPGFFCSEKLMVTAQALRLRRARPEWFAGGYEPLTAAGAAAAHALAFRRGGAVTVATRLPVGLRRGGGWRDTALTLPGGGRWADALTGSVHEGPAVPLAELTDRLPVALLVSCS
jgi:(1->4)-alpha-D-glucan 1-alpha-D-glucosylmutase